MNPGGNDLRFPRKGWENWWYRATPPSRARLLGKRQTQQEPLTSGGEAGVPLSPDTRLGRQMGWELPLSSVRNSGGFLEQEGGKEVTGSGGEAPWRGCPGSARVPSANTLPP